MTRRASIRFQSDKTAKACAHPKDQEAVLRPDTAIRAQCAHLDPLCGGVWGRSFHPFSRARWDSCVRIGVSPGIK